MSDRDQTLTANRAFIQ